MTITQLPQIRKFKANSRSAFALDLHEVWQNKRLIPFLAWREITSRYRVLPLAVLWSIAQPLSTALIAALFFGQLGRIPASGLPIAVFTFSGTTVWQYFINTASASAAAPNSFGTILKKLYFPRLVLPITLTICPLLDLAIASVAVLVMALFWQVPMHFAILELPLLALLTFITGLGISSWFSALSITYYDIRHLIPFLMQLWFLSSPVLYPVSIVPDKWRLLYFMNPATGIISGLRWSIFHIDQPSGPELAMSTAVALVVCISGQFCFKALSRRFADII